MMRPLLALLCLAPGLALGQESGFTYTLSPPGWSNIINTSGLYNLQIQNLQDDYRHRDKGTGSEKSRGKPAPATFVPQASVDTAAKLAESYPAEARPKVRATFHDLLEKYHAVEARYGLPKGDLAGAVTMFVVGSYEAYHRKNLDGTAISSVLAQMRKAVASNPAILQSPDRAKQEMYEQLAILGMFMAGTNVALQSKPDARIQSSLSKAGKGYLEGLLKVNVDRIHITNEGLAFR